MQTTSSSLTQFFNDYSLIYVIIVEIDCVIMASYCKSEFMFISNN